MSINNSITGNITKSMINQKGFEINTNNASTQNDRSDKLNMINKYKHTNKIAKNVFIIHGHNEAKWRELEEFLLSKLQLNPIVLSKQVDCGNTIIEKFEHYANTCEYAFAIFTPDDFVNEDNKTYYQARPNVIFELGWFYGHLGRNRVCILSEKSEAMEYFSDLHGVLRKEFHEHIRELFEDIRDELLINGVV